MGILARNGAEICRGPLWVELSQVERGGAKSGWVLEPGDWGSPPPRLNDAKYSK